MRTARAVKRSAKVKEEYEIEGGPGISKRDAILVADAMRRIEREEGRLDFVEQSDALVERSRSAKSPTHHLFEWDADKGHAIYLRDRARALISFVRVRFVSMPETKLRFFPVVVSGGKRGPMPLPSVMRDDALMRSLVERAKREAVQWAERHRDLRHIAELAGVFSAVGIMEPKGVDGMGIERSGRERL